jgi:hypothetical protein
VSISVTPDLIRVHLLDETIEAEILGEVAPAWVGFDDQRDLPVALPILDLLLASNGGVHRGVHLEPDQALHCMGAGEAAERIRAVLVDALEQAGCDAGIKGAVEAAGEQINARVAGHFVTVDSAAEKVKVDPGSSPG